MYDEWIKIPSPARSQNKIISIENKNLFFYNHEFSSNLSPVPHLIDSHKSVCKAILRTALTFFVNTPFRQSRFDQFRDQCLLLVVLPKNSVLLVLLQSSSGILLSSLKGGIRTLGSAFVFIGCFIPLSVDVLLNNLASQCVETSSDLDHKTLQDLIHFFPMKQLTLYCCAHLPDPKFCTLFRNKTI